MHHRRSVRSRRSALLCIAALAAVTVASGHTPYRQWKVYRQRRLLILTSRGNGSFELGKHVARLLANELPLSQAQASRARDALRIASLITTGQMDVALMTRTDAARLLRREPPFEAYQPVALRALVGLDGFLLVCRDDFPDHHAYLVAQALSVERELLPVALAPAPGTLDEPDPVVPTHPGARAYFDGEGPPAR